MLAILVIIPVVLFYIIFLACVFIYSRRIEHEMLEELRDKSRKDNMIYCDVIKDTQYRKEK